MSQSPSPSELSRELREGKTDDLKSRRTLVALSLVGTLAGQIVGLYQMGLIKKLPDPPIPIFDSTKVDASDYAFKRLLSPDAFLMLVSYGLTAWLASAGGKDRAKSRPYLPLLMFGKIAFDVLNAAKLGQEEWAENKKLCFYCQSATLASIVSLFVAWPEAKKAWKNK